MRKVRLSLNHCEFCFYSRDYKAANININLYIVNEPWLYSLAWCSRIHSVTTDNIQILNQLNHPYFFMVSWLSRLFFQVWYSGSLSPYPTPTLSTVQTPGELLKSRNFYDIGDVAFSLFSPRSFCDLQREISIVIIIAVYWIFSVGFFMQYVIWPSNLLTFIIPVKKLKFTDIKILGRDARFKMRSDPRVSLR